MNIDYEMWEDFKTDILSKGFPYNHQTLRNLNGTLAGYTVFVVDRTINWQCMISTPEDIADFETNYKPNSNRNTMYSNDGTPCSLSTISNTPDGSTWMQQTSDAEWSKRELPSSAILPDGSIVVMGGSDGSNLLNDVWRSLDNGVTWTLLTASAGWSARAGHSCVVASDGSIILAGGIGEIGSLNDVWRSTNKGQNWTQMTASAEWDSRYWHSSVALHDGSILIMGGSGDSIIIANDVWRSTNNGATWTRVAEHAGWTERYYHTGTVAPDGCIVVMGGMDTDGTRNDVWKSIDKGITWEQLTANAWWSPRYGHTSVITLDGNILLAGGYDDNGLKNDVWKSTNGGISWTQITPNADWAARFNHASVMTSDGSIIIMGGSPLMNDVWRSTNIQIVKISGQSVFVYLSGGSITASISGQPVVTSVSGNTVTTSVSGNIISVVDVRVVNASGYCNTSATVVSTSFTGDRPYTYDGTVVKTATVSRWSGNLVLSHTGVVRIAGIDVTLTPLLPSQTISSTTTFVSGYAYIFASGDTHNITFANASGGYTTSGSTLSMRAVYRVI